MSYNPGMHLIATLYTQERELLRQYHNFRQLANEIIDRHHLRKLGEVYHNFMPEGFTAVVCLSESHLSIHTWPEFGKINIDIYLSNFERSNDDAVQQIYLSVQRHFRATVEQEQFLRR